MCSEFAQIVICRYRRNDHVAQHGHAIGNVGNIGRVAAEIKQCYSEGLIPTGYFIVEDRNINNIDPIFHRVERIGGARRCEMNEIQPPSPNERIIDPLNRCPAGHAISHDHRQFVGCRIGAHANRDQCISAIFASAGTLQHKRHHG